MARILIVDDEPDICELLEITLRRMKLDVQTSQSVREAQRALQIERFDLVVTDMQLPDGNGMELVQYIQKQHPNLPVAVITAFGSIDMATAALKAGAFDFVSKPVDLPRLRELIQAALQKPQPQTEESPLMGHSEVIQQLRATVAKVARGQAPVFISGASGSGKERVARLIHELGTRAAQGFVPVNCGAIPAELMESEFFGHRKGSFTGAHEDKAGLFQAADGGTLFLDEVADLPLAMQVKLLRALQEKSIRPVGANQEIAVNVRIIAATHKDIQTEVQAGRFRQDLFYRLHVIPIQVPSLKEHSDDIPSLSQHFLHKIAEDWAIAPPRLTPQAQATLQAYDFPGNVRELQNILERAMTLSDQQLIDAEHLQLPRSAPQEHSTSSLMYRPEDHPLEDFLLAIERKAILDALATHHGNRTKAAKSLGMTFRSLRYRLKKMGLAEEEKDEPTDDECTDD